MCSPCGVLLFREDGAPGRSREPIDGGQNAPGKTLQGRLILRKGARSICMFFYERRYLATQLTLFFRVLTTDKISG
jgi:hypothetical protein